MSTEAYGLEPRHLLALVVMQCILQGLLICMLASFLSSKSASSRPMGFKLYVVFVNALSFAQTTVTILQGFEMLDVAPHKQILVLVYFWLTGINSAAVQAFFMHRCWRIFEKRILPIIPFLVLFLAFFASGVMVVICGSVVTGSKEARNKSHIVAVCVSSSFVLDLLMTTTTIIFLYRTRTGLGEHDSLFTAIWRIMWVSAAPPLVLMSIILINGYIIPSGPPPLTILSAAIIAKVSTLSLMINLLGQNHLRQRLDRSRPSQILNVDSSRGAAGIISEPVFAPITVTTYTIEEHLSPSDSISASTADLSQNNLPRDHSKPRSGTSNTPIEKPREVEDSHAVQFVCFPRNEEPR
ncbi:unnamed protein product [Rhizoctonia solani]|uniref:Uncharacterized protein n=1 Tax=Rhizoctonia solani TaxID=456999 RepID=A0A8H3BBJ7_9AGAM|nr:unnamed protein product [Rhizoctonia solani]